VVSMDKDGTASGSIPSALDNDLDRRTPIEIEFWVQGRRRRSSRGQTTKDNTNLSGKQSGYGGQTKPVFHKKAKTVRYSTSLR
jgi:hypothetical protein